MAGLCAGAAIGTKLGFGSLFGPVGLVVAAGGMILAYKLSKPRHVPWLERTIDYESEYKGWGGRRMIISDSSESSESGPPTFRNLRLNGQMDSSELEAALNLGEGDACSNLRKDRHWKKDKKGHYVEADHIPPLQSLRMARELDGFSDLHRTNPGLYRIAMKLFREDDILRMNGSDNLSPGNNHFAIQVLTNHHRVAISTGNSLASREARRRVAVSIAKGDGMTMLKQSFIIAHPIAADNIRNQAGVDPVRREILIPVTDETTRQYYQEGFLKAIRYYYEKNVISSYERRKLIEYVEREKYLDNSTEEYQEFVEIFKRYR